VDQQYRLDEQHRVDQQYRLDEQHRVDQQYRVDEQYCLDEQHRLDKRSGGRRVTSKHIVQERTLMRIIVWVD
jgi:hypothetical protein